MIQQYKRKIIVPSLSLLVVLAFMLFIPLTVHAATAEIDFENTKDFDEFEVYVAERESSFEVVDGELVTEGNVSEQKVIMKNSNSSGGTIEVDIIPKGEDFCAGIYIGAWNPKNPLNQIESFVVMVESNFEGWDDAKNRVDLVIGEFPKWNELARATTETGRENNLYWNGNKEPLHLKVEFEENVITTTLSRVDDPACCITQSTLLPRDAYGSVGLRVIDTNKVAFDNFKVTTDEYTGTMPGGEKPTIPEQDVDRVDLYDFQSLWDALDFDFYHSSNGGFTIKDGKLKPSGELGEFKAILRGDDRAYQSVSVDIYPEKDGTINSGLYIGTTGAGHAVDTINALGILVQSDYEGWEDAANRVDIIVGSFPTWKELSRTISETGAGNALFTNGVKEPLNLKVDIDGEVITITVSLLSNPDVYVQTAYEYAGEYDLVHGAVGIRSMSDTSSFDNFKVAYKTEATNEDEKTDTTTTDTNKESNKDSNNTSTETGDNMGTTMLMAAVMVVASLGTILFILNKKRRTQR